MTKENSTGKSTNNKITEITIVDNIKSNLKKIFPNFSPSELIGKIFLYELDSGRS